MTKDNDRNGFLEILDLLGGGDESSDQGEEDARREVRDMRDTFIREHVPKSAQEKAARDLDDLIEIATERLAPFQEDSK